jgi:signal peptidase I
MAAKRKSEHPLRDNIEVMVFAVAMALGLKVFALEAYQIPTGSMQPTLMGTVLLDPDRNASSGGVHDRVLVDKLTYLLRDPKRWEVAVFRYPLATVNSYVKRVVGLPGEELWIRHGDLWAKPEGVDAGFRILRKPASLQKHLWKMVRPLPGSPPAAWSGWRRSGAFEPGVDGPLNLVGRANVELRVPVRDDYRDGYPAGIRSRIPISGGAATSHKVVSDLKVGFQATPRAGGGTLHLRCDFGPYPVHLEIPADKEKEIRIALPDEESVTLEGISSPGEPISCEVSFWDHHLEVHLESGNREAVFKRDFTLEPVRSSQNSIRFSTEEGGWTLELPSLWRDIHYLSPLNGGTPVFEIPDGHYFMMGDNTQNSLDSRDWEARVLVFDPPVDGVAELRGDFLQHGSDPFYDNPRWNGEGSLMTFRDRWGSLHTLTRDDLKGSKDRREHSPLVPRRFILGKATAVFLPIPPFSPVVRIGLVH